MKFIKDQFHSGWPATSIMVQTAIGFIRQSKPPPDLDWVRIWVKGHREIVKTRMKPIDSKRRSAQNPEVIQDWFLQFNIDVKNKGIKPENMWNMDETGFRAGCPYSQDVIIPVGQSQASIDRGVYGSTGQQFQFPSFDLVLRATQLSTSNSESLELLSTNSISSSSSVSSIVCLRGLPRTFLSFGFSSAACTISNTSAVENTNSPCNLILLPLVLFLRVSSRSLHSFNFFRSIVSSAL